MAQIIGTSGNDPLLYGTAFRDTIVGLAGDDSIFGRDANDTLQGDEGDDFIDGGDGEDRIEGGTGEDELYGENGNDTIFGDDDADFLYGGHWKINTFDNLGTGNDLLFGGEGDDTLAFSWEDLVVSGDDGDDVFVPVLKDEAGGSALFLEGGDGSDWLDMSADIDRFFFAGNPGTSDMNLTADLGSGTATISYMVPFSAGPQQNFTVLLNGIENLSGGEDIDSLTGDGAGNVIYGNGGDDVLTGGGGADTLIGGAGTDTLLGGVGNDTFSSEDPAEETVEGGLGADTLYVDGTAADRSGFVLGATGNLTGIEVIRFFGYDRINDDILTFPAFTGDLDVDLDASLGDSLNDGVLTVVGGEGDDNIDGSHIGASASLVIDGSGGVDTLTGGDGNDTLDGGEGSDAIDGGDGIDTIDFSNHIGAIVGNLLSGVFTNGLTDLPGIPGQTKSGGTIGGGTIGGGTDTVDGIENITGSSYPDDLGGDGLDNVIDGGDGNDVLAGGGGNNTINGGDGIDTVDFSGRLGGITGDLSSGVFTAGVIVVPDITLPNGQTRPGFTIGGGTDTVDGIENITGSSGADNLGGDGLDNVIDGGDGNDVLAGGGGNNTINGGDGIDTVDFSGRLGGITGDLSSGVFTAGVIVVPDITLPNGQTRPGFTIGGGTDTVDGIENITGSSGADNLGGDGLDNVIDGGDGDDTLIGGLGLDEQLGGSGNDTFVFNSTDESPAFASGGGLGADILLDFDDDGTGAGGAASLFDDLIDLAAADANEQLAGDQAFFLDDRDGVNETGELIISSTFDVTGQQVSFLFALTDGDLNADFAIQFDRVITTFGTDDFVL